MACDRQDKPKNVPQSEQDYDSTEKNIPNRNSMTKNPFDQSENEADRMVTQKT